jgi:hypothetical protein
MINMQKAYRHSILKGGSLKINTALEYSTRVVQEGGRRCKKSTLNDLVHLSSINPLIYTTHLTPLRIPLMNPPLGIQINRLQLSLHSELNTKNYTYIASTAQIKKDTISLILAKSCSCGREEIQVIHMYNFLYIFLFVLSAWRLFAVEAQDEEEEGGYRSVLPRILC